MRIANYNIMSGGFDGYDMVASQPQRLPEIKAAIRELNADVIGLVDTFRWGTADQNFTKRVAEEKNIDLIGARFEEVRG